jgi:DNA replication protein DnaC
MQDYPMPVPYRNLDFATWEWAGKQLAYTTAQTLIQQEWVNLQDINKHATIPTMMKGPRRGMVIVGKPNVGKTVLAAWIAREWLAKGFRVDWITFRPFLASVQGSYSEGSKAYQIIDRISNSRYLIIDDLVSSLRGHGLSADKLHLLDIIITNRAEKRLPTIITTTLTTQKEWEASTDGSILKSVLSLCAWVELGGKAWGLLE